MNIDEILEKFIKVQQNINSQQKAINDGMCNVIVTLSQRVTDLTEEVRILNEKLGSP